MPVLNLNTAESPTISVVDKRVVLGLSVKDGATAAAQAAASLAQQYAIEARDSIIPSFDLDGAGVVTSTAPDGGIVKSNVFDPFTKGAISFKETEEIPTVIDGIINILKEGKYYKRVLSTYNLGEFNVLPENSAALNAANFEAALSIIPHDSRVMAPTGVYYMDDVTITKSGMYDFTGVIFRNSEEIEGQAIKIDASAEYVYIFGLKQEYDGVFYTGNPDYTDTYGVNKHAISTDNKKTILVNCRASGFSSRGFNGGTLNGAFYLLNCTSNNNGYAGCGSSGKDFQVFGGEYSENGGSNSVRDGYGVICNMYNGDSKVIGVRSVGNCTRNLDSHVGKDLIFANNYVVDAGKPHPQWFNTTSSDGLNLRVTQRIDRCIISGNIVKRGVLAGISIDAGLSDDYLRNITISGNLVEDNKYQIYIRPLEINKISVVGNQEINNLDPENPVERGLLVNPFSDPDDDRTYIQDFHLRGNSFDSTCDINLTDFPQPENPTKLSVLGNTFIKGLNVYCGNNNVSLNISANNIFDVTVTGATTKSVLTFTGNNVDADGTDTEFTVASGFNGYINNSGNTYLNSISVSQIFVQSNSSFIGNTIVINHEIVNNSAGSVIRATGSNYRISGNTILFNNVTPFGRIIRFTANSLVVIRDNTFSGNSRLDHSGGNLTVAKLLWDPIAGEFDLGSSSAPSIVYGGFKNGDRLKINSVSVGGFIGLVCTVGGDTPTWVGYGKIGP